MLGLAVRLATSLVCCLAEGRRVRRCQVELLAVVGRPGPAQGTVVVDHPVPAAYCLSGRPAQVVLTTSALEAPTTTSWPPSWLTRPPTCGAATTW